MRNRGLPFVDTGWFPNFALRSRDLSISFECSWYSRPFTLSFLTLLPLSRTPPTNQVSFFLSFFVDPLVKAISSLLTRTDPSCHSLFFFLFLFRLPIHSLHIPHQLSLPQKIGPSPYPFLSYLFLTIFSLHSHYLLSSLTGMLRVGSVSQEIKKFYCKGQKGESPIPSGDSLDSWGEFLKFSSVMHPWASNGPCGSWWAFNGPWGSFSVRKGILGLGSIF